MSYNIYECRRSLETLKVHPERMRRGQAGQKCGGIYCFEGAEQQQDKVAPP